jgi:hypothetical protein
MSTDDEVKRADELKAKGNALFGQDKFKEASEEYTAAIELVRYICQQSLVKLLALRCHNVLVIDSIARLHRLPKTMSYTQTVLHVTPRRPWIDVKRYSLRKHNS